MRSGPRCTCAPSGRIAAALPRSAMNSRRLTVTSRSLASSSSLWRRRLARFLRLFLRRLWSLDRRQRFHIFADRGAVGWLELQHILDHRDHRAAGAVAVGRDTILQVVGDVFRAPVAKPLLRHVRHPALAFRIGAARKALARDDAAEEIARAVALGAMAKAVDEIGAA